MNKTQGNGAKVLPLRRKSGSGNPTSTQPLPWHRDRTFLFQLGIGALCTGLVAYWISSSRKAHKTNPSTRSLTPSDPEKPFGGNTRDLVDEASWESFPASDPPAY